MKKAISGRQTGKTEKLIKLSTQTGGTIITFNREAAKSILLKANKMGVSIPEPIDIEKLMSEAYRNSISDKMSNVIIDDADRMLELILKKFNVASVDAISMCNDDVSDELI